MTATDHASDSTVVKIEDWSLGVHRRGEGPPVVLLHGLLTDSRVWQQVIEDLPATHQLIAIDAPGHGSSPPRTAAYSLEEESTRLAEAVESLTDGQPAVWVGHSMGGMKAMRVALSRPDLTTGLVLISTQPYREPESTADPYEAMVEVAIADGVSPDLARLMARLNFARGFLGTDTAQHWTTHFRTLVGDDIAQTCYSVYRRGDISDQLPRIDVPVLVVHGAADVPIRLAVAQRYAAELPHAELLVLADTGHTPPCERPAELGAALREFVARVTGSTTFPADAAIRAGAHHLGLTEPSLPPNRQDGTV
ncbi:alpha/beta hydrolase [Micromonospora sp. WMMA1947]|uniref:alpha/beta fold hydrolase n=1 Tax=Micromonospora sp. WMMA1947 TaxID=3015163 RepID=UPI00248C56DD|nr:alpha/beta hydrolase [Micromonospora sp. WMMA1947]WBC07461.1 alpha/beta hydrolase [Micromonospora sp. WMMA1947]